MNRRRTLIHVLTGSALMVSAAAGGELASTFGFDPADSTRSLQAALDSPTKRLTIDNPGSPWIITPLELPGDKEITFEKGVIIEAKRGGFLGKNDCLFTARNRNNLAIHGNDATLRMHKADYHKPPLQTRRVASRPVDSRL